jgi:hypothetical protein
MTRPVLSDLPPKFQAQALAQLHATQKPRTVKIEVAGPIGKAPAAKRAPKAKASAAIQFFAANGVATPTAEYKFAPDRRWRFDFAWPEHKIALEVEGGVWTNGRHTRGSGFVKDMQKYNRAAVLGWRVVRVVPSELRRTETAAMIRAMMNVAELRDHSDPRIV